MVPANLPTGVFPTNGYAATVDTATDETEDETEDTVSEVSTEMKELEDRAHAHKVLLSSDAMRHFVSVCPKALTRMAFLEKVIGEAKVTYPSEDGWVVLNCERMQELCQIRHTDTPVTETVTVADAKKVAVPVGAGSLAEAIVTGNVAAAYAMIGHRPMIALADASADLDALYRQKNGEAVAISELLIRESEVLAPETIKAAIADLTSALDGTYDSEEQAVKVAIMKAIKTIQ